MRILLINGTQRRESTYHIARMLIQSLGGGHEVREVFLPEAMPEFCLGCGSCFMLGEEKCPHHSYSAAFLEKLEWAELLVFATPVYVYHTTGQMKTLLDHFGYMWMVHRPKGYMFKKQAVVISTAAGGGMRSAGRDITDSLRYWGVGRIHTYGKAVMAIRWAEVKPERRKKIASDMKRMAGRIKTAQSRVRPALSRKCLFLAMRMMHKTMGGLNETDHRYWKEMGWLGRKRPY